MKKLNELQSYLTRLRGLMLTLIVLFSWGSVNVWGAEGDTHDFSQSLQQLLNGDASIASINIAAQSYPVKEVIISFRYNKTIENAVTMEVLVGGTSWGTAYSEGTKTNYTTRSFTDDATTGAIVINFTNNTGSGTGHGTFYVNNVRLVEGAASDPHTVTLMDTGETLTESSAGAGVTLPSRAGCTGYTFAGWTASWNTDQTTWTTTAPTIINAGAYSPSGDVNLYPVYTKTSGGGSSTVTFTPGTDTGTTSVTKSVVTCTMSTMNNASYYQIYADASGTFSVSSGNITAISFTCTNSNTEKYGPGNASADVGTYSYDGYVGSWSGSANSVTISATKQVRMEALSVTCTLPSTTSYISVPNCCTDPGLNYATGSVTKTYGDPAFTNTLTNSHSVAVTYAASNVTPAGCITVNSSTGAVTINGAGSATITASSAAQTVSTVDYCADEASYTLTVNKASISPTLTYTPNSVAAGSNTSAPTVGGNPGSGGVTYAITSATPEGCATINTSTGVVTGVAVGSVTVTATVAATDNYNGGTATANVTITAASYFTNGVTVFIQTGSVSSAWDASACVKAWFNASGAGGAAQTTYWLYDGTGDNNGKKLFATIVPATGDLNQVTLQRFDSNCSDFWNNNGTLTKASDGGSNTFRTEGPGTSAVAWNASGVALYLYGNPNSWESSLGTFADQGNGVWTATYENYAPANAAGESQEFKIFTSYNDWIGNTGSNNNATLDGMHVGSTYNITATLDVKDHSLTMSKTFVKGTVHFDLQGHGSAISDLTNVAAGSKISAPSTPSATGYDFGGWYTEPACTNEWNFATDVVNETMTLYAKWTTHSYTITTTLNNVTSSSAIPSTYTYTGEPAGLSYTISADAGYRLPTTITVSGTTYTWDPATGALALTGTIESDVSISIVGVRAHTITWSANGETTTSIVDDGNTLVLPAVDPTSCDAGDTDTYTTFIGWYSTAAGSNSSPTADISSCGTKAVSTHIPTGNETYYAVWGDGGVEPVETKEITLDFTNNTNWQFPNGSANKIYSSTENSYTSGGYTIKIAGDDNSSNGYYFNSSNNFFLIGKSGSYIKFPAFSFTTSKIVVTGKSGASGSTKENIYVGETSVSEETTGSTGTNTFEIANAYRAAGNIYQLQITSNHNAQITQIDIYSTSTGATGFISSCCGSAAVVTVSPESSSLALDIDGNASTSISISQTGAGNGRYHEPTITPVAGASTNWTGSYKTNPYSVTFTATAAGTYTVKADFTETAAGCAKYGSATITVAANPILTPSSNSVEIKASCGAESSATDITVNSRYLAGSSITASIAKSTGSGTFTISSDGSAFDTSNKTISGGTTTKVSSHIYVRYEAIADEVGSATGTLTLTQGETVVNIPITATVTCGCNIRFTSAADLVRVTAANGIWVQAASELALSGSYLKTNSDNANVSIRAYTDNAHFQLKTSGSAGEGAAKTSSSNALALATNEGSNMPNGWTGAIGIVYKPEAHNTTESATLTVEVYRYGGTTIYSSTTYTLYGRSLPENFVIAVTNGSGDWFAVPADMVAPWGGSCSSGLGNYIPYPIEVDNTTAPTSLTSNPPSRAVYTAAARTGNINTNPQTMSYKSVTLAGSGTYYLYGSVSAEGSATHLQDASNETSEKQKWFLDVIDWETKKYNMHLSSDLNTNLLSYYSGHVGQYAATGKKPDIFILPVTVTCDYYLAPTDITCQGIDNTYYYFRFKPDRTSNYEVSLNGSAWSDLATEIVTECTDENHPTLLEGKVALETYRGQTVYIRVKSAGGCQSNTTFSVPNPSVEVNAGTWMNMTGMAGYAFANSANSVTISGLASCGDQEVSVTSSNSDVTATLNQSTGVVTLSMSAAKATAGTHTGTLTFTLTGGTTRTQNFSITLQAKAAQEWDGGDVSHFWNGMLCDEEGLSGDPTVRLAYALYYEGSVVSSVATVNTNSTCYLLDVNIGTKVTTHTITRSVISGGIFQVDLINLTSNNDLVIGHHYRLVWENHSEDNTIKDAITNENGVPFQDCSMDFVYTQDCSSPTLMPGCASGTTAYVSWGNTSASCDNYTLEWYQRTETNVIDYSIKDHTNNLIVWANGGNCYEANNNYLDDWIVSNNSDTYKSTSYGYQVSGSGSVRNYIYTPRLNTLYSSTSTSTEYEVTVTLQNTGTANAYAATCFAVDNTNSSTTVITSGYKANYNGVSTNYHATKPCPVSSSITDKFVVSGLTATSRIGFSVYSTPGNKLFVKNVDIKRLDEGAHSSATIDKSEEDYTITGLTEGKKYYAVLTCGSSTSNEISFTTTSGASAFHFYSDGGYSNEITEAEIVAGTPKTVYFRGTNMPSCDEPTATINSCFNKDDESLSYNTETKVLTGYVTISNICAAADGELTINLGGHYPLPLHCGDRQIEVVQWAQHGIQVESYVLSEGTPQVGSIVGVANNGAYNIQDNALDLTAHANELLKVTWGTHIENFRVPIMVTSNSNSNTLTTVNEKSIIVVMPGKTLTINNALTCEGIEIYPTAKVQFYSGSLTADYIRLYNNGDTWANFAKLDVTDASSISVSHVYADFRIDEDRFHYITLPFDIATGDVTYAAPTANGAYAPALRDASHATAFYVRQYDGRARETNNLATENTYNVNMPHIGAKGGSYTMTTGRGYMIGIGDQMSATGHKKRTLRFPITMTSTNWTEESASSKIVGGEWIADGTDNASARATNKGWNLVGNPFMRELTVTSTSGGLATGYLDETGGNPIWEINDDGIRYITIYNAATDAFTYQPLNTSFTLKPMAAFYVQMKNAKYIHFQEALNGQASMPAILRAPFEEQEDEVNVIISLSNENQSDKAGIVLHSKYDAAYNEADDADYPKLMSNTQLALWSIVGEERLASNGLPKTAIENIPLGYQAPTTGHYSFTLNMEESNTKLLKHVWLTDLETATVRDLLLEDYTFNHTQSEQSTTRFLLGIELFTSEELTTSVDEYGDSNVDVKPIKFIYKGMMYIQSHGVIYDATGKRVREIR